MKKPIVTVELTEKELRILSKADLSKYPELNKKMTDAFWAMIPAKREYNRARKQKRMNKA